MTNDLPTIGEPNHAKTLAAFREELEEVATAYHTADQTTGATIAQADDLARARENYVTALRLVRNAVRYG